MKKTLYFLLLTSFAAPVCASDEVMGFQTNFTSPNGLIERCVRITPVPGGTYSDGDLEDAAEYCSIDLYVDW